MSAIVLLMLHEELLAERRLWDNAVPSANVTRIRTMCR
jgi:hypothetical protein